MTRLLCIALVAVGCTGLQPGDTGWKTCQPDPDPGASWEGHVLDGWRWEKLGPLWEDGDDIPSGSGDLAPAVAVTGGGSLFLVFTRKDGLEHQLWASTSYDGASWGAPVPLEGLPAGSFVAYPGLLQDDDTLLLAWVADGDLHLAAHRGGSTWEVLAGSFLEPGEGGAFDHMGTSYPSLARDDDGYVLLYSGFDGWDYAIGRATSADGVTWRRHGDRGVLTKGDAGDFDNRAVAQPALLRAGDTWLLFYGGYDTSVTDPGPWRVGLARSSDGIAWEKVGVSLPLATEGVDAWSTRDPAVVPWGDGWLMIYAGMGDDGRYRLLRATSTACP